MDHERARLRAAIENVLKSHLPGADVPVRHALALAAGSVAAERLLAALREGVRDAGGQVRPAYGPMAVACAVRAAGAMQPLVAAEICRRAEGAGVSQGIGSPSAESSQRLADTLWTAWLLCLAGAPDEGADLAEKALARHPAYPRALPADISLDDFVFNEFVALHALGNLVTLAPRLLPALGRATVWHVENTQPDNTTHQPWGLAAFAGSPETISMAWQQLHDATVARSSLSPITLTLLADAWVTLAADNAGGPG